MNKAIIYIHGKGGSAEEAAFYAPLFPESTVLGFDYKAQTPWEAGEEFACFFDTISRSYDEIAVIAVSIGAYFLMNTPTLPAIRQAWFVSPIVDMEALIAKMMTWANVTEEELKIRQTIPTDFGENLSWEYLSHVRSHPLHWTVPTHILYGEKDTMTDYAVMAFFAEKTGAALDVMPDGEHWFHAKDQLAYLAHWIKKEFSGESL